MRKLNAYLNENMAYFLKMVYSYFFHSIVVKKHYSWKGAF